MRVLIIITYLRTKRARFAGFLPFFKYFRRFPHRRRVVLTKLCSFLHVAQCEPTSNGFVGITIDAEIFFYSQDKFQEISFPCESRFAPVGTLTAGRGQEDDVVGAAGSVVSSLSCVTPRARRRHKTKIVSSLFGLGVFKRTSRLEFKEDENTCQDVFFVGGNLPTKVTTRTMSVFYVVVVFFLITVATPFQKTVFENGV